MSWERRRAAPRPGGSAAFLRRRDGSEPLLTRCVPDLQLHPLPVDVHRPDFEVDADGGDVAACGRNNASHGRVP